MTSRGARVLEYDSVWISGGLDLLLNPASIRRHTYGRKDRSDALDQLLFNMRLGIFNLFAES